MQAEVKKRETDEIVRVCVTSLSKPEVNKEKFKQWVELLNDLVKILRIPAALIMKINEKYIEVFERSINKENPYKLNEKAPLKSGLYCETVIAQNRELLISDALKNDAWKDNPDIDLNMISYLGLPIKWPDGEFFGTICVLDKKYNAYSVEKEKELLYKYRDIIELDLKNLLENNREYLH